MKPYQAAKELLDWSDDIIIDLESGGQRAVGAAMRLPIKPSTRSLLRELHAYMTERADADWSDKAEAAVGNEEMHFKRWIEKELNLGEDV